MQTPIFNEAELAKLTLGKPFWVDALKLDLEKRISGVGESEIATSHTKDRSTSAASLAVEEPLRKYGPLLHLPLPVVRHHYQPLPIHNTKYLASTVIQRKRRKSRRILIFHQLNLALASLRPTLRRMRTKKRRSMDLLCIVCESQLDLLLASCRTCRSAILDTKKTLRGSALSVVSLCAEGHRHTWHSQPKIGAT